MAQFDVAAARKAGYTDDEIMQHLAGTSQFDVNGALKAGHSKADIVDYLSQHSTAPASATSGPPSPTAFDNFTSGLTGDPLKPGGDPLQQSIQGTASSLGRTSQAWHDMFTGNANPMTPIEMVPIFGPQAADAGRMLATPGQRMKGLGAAAAILVPPILHGAPYEMPEMPTMPAPIAKAAAVAKGAGKGAWEGATAPTPISHGILSTLPPVPASIAGGVGGAAIGKYLAGQPGEIAGGMVGAGVPIVRGAIQGGKQALGKFKAGVGVGASAGAGIGADIPPPPVESPMAGPPTAAPQPPVAPPSSSMPPAASAPPPFAPSPAAPPSTSGAGGGLNTTAIQGHEASTINKIRNLGDYLISKGGDTSHLEQIVQDPQLTRQYLNEAKDYGARQGNPVPKGAYKGLDVETHPDSTYQRLRSYIMDKINEAKTGQ
jgi:hypothetical protein